MNKELLRAQGLEPIVSDAVVLLAPLPRFWTAFEASEEHRDGVANPLDRFSKRIINALADTLQTEAVYPSDGPPYAPFVAWALQAEGIYQAPNGLLVHDEFGLFISFRGALLLANQPKRISQNPCINCDQPCLSACPVGAFQEGEYKVETCQNHLRSGQVACWQGCLARRACPANHISRPEAQSAFSMRAFMA